MSLTRKVFLLLTNRNDWGRRWAPFLIAKNLFCTSQEDLFNFKKMLRELNRPTKAQVKDQLNDSGIHLQDDLNESTDGILSSLDPKKKFTVSIEGNIGCGKTTLLEYYKHSPQVEAIAEPVEQWTNVQGHNALGLLYEDPSRWSFSFNMYAQLTRIQMHKKKQVKPIKMLERSIFSTQYCFVENDYRNGTLNGLEHAIISEWFEWLIKSQTVKVDLIVYLRADPEICHERIKKRSRKEESCVPFKLIQELHDLHEDWLIRESSFKSPAPVLVVDANKDYKEMINVYEERKQEILCGYN